MIVSPFTRTTKRGALRAALAAVVVAGFAAGAVSAVATPAGAQPTANHNSSAKPWLPATPLNWPQVVDYTQTPAETITRGVTHHSETYDTVGGRQQAQVLDVDLADRNVRVGVTEAGDTITNPADETVSSMADRTHAVAAVNGDYFEIHASGRPLGGVISDGELLKSPRAGFNAQLGVKPDGTMVIGRQTFSGTITVGSQSHPLDSVNVVNDLATGGITQVTPYLGASSGLPAATLVLGHAGAGDSFVVDSVKTDVTSVGVLPKDQVGLLGAGAGGTWLAGAVHTGDSVTLTKKIAPDDDLTQLVSGATMLVKDGQAYTDPNGNPPSGVNPETAVGISKDGKHATVVTIDGHGGSAAAFGVTPDQVAGYLLAHGAYTGMLFDGGGSAEMVTRAPGDDHVSVTNVPSDSGNVERPVANGIFLYTTATAAGPAKKVVVNGGKPVTTVPGGTIPAPVYAVDTLGNPASGTNKVWVEPRSLATWADGKLTPHRSGTGRIFASNGHARTSQKLQVVDKLETLAVSPDAPDLNNSGTRQFTLSGTTRDGTAVDIPAEAATWSSSAEDLGKVDEKGFFTAADLGGGMVTVTAKVAGATATAAVAVGNTSKMIDNMSSTGVWRLSNNTTGKPATLTADSDLPPGSSAPGSLKLSYTMPAGSGVKQLVLSSSVTLKTTTSDDGKNPTGIGLWIKGNGTGIMLAESYIDVSGARTTLYPTNVTWQGWQFAIAQLPAGMQFPLTISFVDFLAISPSQTTGGSLNVSGLQALYAPRPVVVPPYTAIPENPSWLKFEEDSGDFEKNGHTVLAGDDAHMLASDPESASSHVMDAIKNRIPSLAPEARPDQVQMLGDMSDDGKLADLQFAKSKIDTLGVPARDVVGNHEITQGADAENVNFAQVFGDSHYAYQAGQAQVIVTDNARGSLLSADPYQVPVEPQYPWLVKQLTDATAPAVVVVTHMPAYDPHAAANSQFTDRWEARMYLRLVQKYQLSHKDRHVIMLYGHARGFAEQILDPKGESVTTAEGGIPQITIADLGMPAYAPADEGGFYHFSLFHVTKDGDFQFSVEPVLESIEVTAPSETLATGASMTLTAAGKAVGGDNLPGITVPISDPASHVWTSSEPKVASVDPVSGKVTAHSRGTVTVSVSSGGVTGSVNLTVG
jgi:exopolysaccharide biosynthesis protein